MSSNPNTIEAETGSAEMHHNSPLVWSFFSGAMGLDLGFERSGLAPSLCVELDETCCSTIRLNRPGIRVVQRSITDLIAADLGQISGHRPVDLIIGGPPCQSFSTGGNRCGLSDPRGNLIYEYLRLIREARPRFFLLENVAGLVTAAIRHRPIQDRPGKRWNLSSYRNGTSNLSGDAPPLEPDEMSGTAVTQMLADAASLGYRLNLAILDAAEHGAAQHRLRFIMVGARDTLPPRLPVPVFGPLSLDGRPFRALRDAIADLVSDPGPHSNYGDFMSRFYNLVPPGGNWRNLPVELHAEALGPSLGAGGGKTGFFRRLAWDEPAPTITGKANRKATGLCHPSQLRPLSVRECARIQGFPDDWQFSGSMHDAYQQIGNAVPVQLGTAVALCIAQALQGTTVESDEDIRVAVLLDRAIRKLRGAARNKRTSRSAQPSAQMGLCDYEPTPVCASR